MTDIPEGEGVLAFLDRAITEREAAARAVSYDTFETHEWGWGATHLALVHGEQRVIDAEMEPALAAHIVLHDPESVLRRCTADRKLIYEVRRTATNAKSHPWDPMYGPYAEAMLAAAKVVAEGYGWTEGER